MLQETKEYNVEENEYPENQHEAEYEPEHQKEFGGPDEIEEEYQPIEEQEQQEIEEQQSNVHSSPADMRDRISHIQRQRYQALQEAETLRQENERLRRAAEHSATQALKQYDDNLAQRFENAKAAKAKAIEEGDVKSQIEADTALSMLSAELYQLNYLKAQQNIQKNELQHQPNQDYQDNSLHVARWSEQNSWFRNDSPEYDEWLSQQVENYCNAFDANLYRNGYGHAIMSPEYLNVIDNHVNALRNYRNNQFKQRELSMRQSRMPVSPVRSGNGEYANSSQQIKISAAEKDLARRLGIDEKTYLQYRIRDEQEYPHRRRGR